MGKSTQPPTPGEQGGEMRAETRAMLLQGEEHRCTPENQQELREGMGQVLPLPPQEKAPQLTPWTQNSGQLLLFKPLILWCFVMTALEN